MNYQNNDVERSNWLLEYHNFLRHCLLRLSILHNNFDSLTKFLDLYLAKFLDTSTKFFCVWKINIYFLISLRLVKV